MRSLLVSSLLLGAIFLWLSLAGEKCPAPKPLTFQVREEIRREVKGFTEGLEAQDGVFFESTGPFLGDTRINRIDPKTGQVTSVLNAGNTYFGEGLTFFVGKFFQMTYREHRVFVFDKSMRPLNELSNPREGWGLTHDDRQLIASDGSNHLYFLSPDDFSTRRVLPVIDEAGPIKNLNELEYVQGSIWANLFGTWDVIKISPRTGCVESRADLRSLRALMSAEDRRAIDANENFVPNGIAYSAASELFAVTGKNWPMLYTGRFVETK